MNSRSQIRPGSGTTRKYLAATLLTALWAAPSMGQNVVATIAGSPKTLPDGSFPPFSAALVPVSVAVAPNSDVYFVEQGSHSVLRLTKAGDLRVVAGTGIEGYSGEGGPAQFAALNSPAGVAVDVSGNLYIADSGNHRIRRVNSQGIIQTIAGIGTFGNAGDGGPATSAQLRFPSGLAFDTAGNLYIADRGNFLIRKISTAGIISRFAGTGSTTPSGDGGPALNAGFGFPEYVAVDSAGNVYISDSAASRVRKVNTAGIITTIAGIGQFGYSGDGGPAINAAITLPQGISVDSAGNVYFGDRLSARVRRITPDGRIDTVAGKGLADFSADGGPATSAGISEPFGVAVDPAGGFLIADSGNARVRRVSAQGTITTVAGSGQAALPKDGGLATDAGLSLPFGVAVSNTGVIFVADRGNKRVRKIGLDGKISTVAGTGDAGYSGDGGAAISARIGYPSGLAADASGNLYIADRDYHRIRKVDDKGIITTFAGNGNPGYAGDGGPAASASLTFPTGVAIDAVGRVLIADSGSNTIRRVDASGTISTVAGSALAGFSGDGGPALQAKLATPSGVAADAFGNIIIADTSNARVRRVSASGTITTIAGPASISDPISVAADAAGNVYFADRGAVRIRKVNTAGVMSVFAGDGFSGFVGDGGLATDARLRFPEGVAVDSSGNVYFTDRDNNRLRVVLANPPTFTVAPSSLSFSATASGASTPASAVTVIPVAASATLNAVGLPVRAVARDSWLKMASDSQSKLPVTLRLSVDPSTLAPGKYQTSLLISSPATPATREVAVSVDVAPALLPQMSLNTHVISLSVTQGAPAVSQEIVVRNVGSGSLNYSALVSPGSSAAWLTLVSGQGTSQPDSPSKIVLTVDPKGLRAGTYSTVLLVKPSAGQQEEVVVNLSIAPAENLMVLSQSGLNYAAVAGGGAPLPQLLYILNAGRGELKWSAEASTLSGGDWLTISSPSGTLPAGSTDATGVDVTAKSSALATGQYYGQIVFRSPDAQNSPQTVAVVLSVLPSGTKLPPEIRPSGLIFSGTRSAPPGAQNVYIANLGSAPFSYASGAYTVDGAPWLQHLPINDSVAPNKPARLTVQADYRNLDPGIYRGVITFQNVDDGSTRTLNVVSVVASDESAAKDSRLAGGCSADRIRLLLTSTQQSISAAVGQAIALEVQIVDSCGMPVTSSNPGVSVTLSLSNRDQGGPLVHSGGGRWSRTYQPKPGFSGRVTASITAFAIGASGRLLVDQGDISIDIADRTPTPIVGSGGVLNSASFEPNKPVAPGSLVTFKGDQLAATGPGQIGSGVPLPQLLNGTEVRLAGRRLPLLYADSGQINAQLPFDLPPDTQHDLVIYRGSVLSLPEAITVSSARPAIFTMNQQGTGQGAIVNGITNVLADSAHPVHEGDIISIYCTGLGAVQPTVTEGTPAPLTSLTSTVTPVSVSIGGSAAQVLFQGLAPGITGLYQVNAVVPNAIPHGDAVTVTITSAAQISAPVTIAVQ